MRRMKNAKKEFIEITGDVKINMGIVFFDEVKPWKEKLLPVTVQKSSSKNEQINAALAKH